MGDLSKHFSSSEFECPCCKNLKVNAKLLFKLEAIREVIGNLPIIVTSGYRCKKYNSSVGGDKNSPHLAGEGVDIKVNSLSPVELALKVEKIKAIRLGIYPNHLHLDIRDANPSRYWLVKKYSQNPIYSGYETDLKGFLKKEKYI